MQRGFELRRILNLEVHFLVNSVVLLDFYQEDKNTTARRK